MEVEHAVFDGLFNFDTGLPVCYGVALFACYTALSDVEPAAVFVGFWQWAADCVCWVFDWLGVQAELAVLVSVVVEETIFGVSGQCWSGCEED